MTADIATAIVMSPQCVLSGVMGVLDVLTSANYVAQQIPQVGTRFRPLLVSDGGGAVQGTNGLFLPAKSDLPDPKSVDIAIIASGPPAIFSTARMQAGLAAQPRLIQWLREVHEAGGIITSCCTGSFLVAATGLLDGRLATTHWRAEAAFRDLFPKVELRIDNLLVEEDRIVTGGGAQSFSTTILWLIRRFQGEAVATATAKLMLAEGRTSGQNAFRQWLPPQDHGDEAIARAQAWLEAHYTEAFDLDALADRLHLTPRTLMRRFKQATGLAPLQYQQKLRVEAAKDQLESTSIAVNQVVWQIGYEDVSSFQRLFKRETGLTMVEYRQRFGGRRHEVPAAAAAL
jgi:transcriptional regulator GlxA family with amidase domain